VYHCGLNDESKISVYIYPVKDYVGEDGTRLAPTMSREFAQILRAIVESPFYTADPNKACIFVPSIDLLNQNNVLTNEVGKVLASLPW
jgi:glucuronyl/N-acetylglucosaminyl transferase EXT2